MLELLFFSFYFSFLFCEFQDALKNDMFEEKDISEETASKSSQLSQLLEDTMYQPSNPYLDYAKFDGEVL